MSYITVTATLYEDEPGVAEFKFATEDGGPLSSQTVLDALVDFLIEQGADFLVKDIKDMH